MEIPGENGVGPDDGGLGQDPHEQSADIASLTGYELIAAFEGGELTSVEVAEQLIGRIEALDSSGTKLRSVLELNPEVLEEAARLDGERQAGVRRGRLHGVPILLKDNIDTVAPLHTTAGSTIFGDGSPGSDATLVGALRAAGALVLGKANLSEWANIRSEHSTSGWSAVGGLTRNPYMLDRTACGSSSGSAAGVAAGLAAAAIGTETDGSITCPSAMNGVVGLKPTVGLVSRTGIVPISVSQDTAGPMARSITDLALLLEVLAQAVDDGEDEAASSSRRPRQMRTDYSALLGDGRLSGLRVGLLRGRGFTDYHPPTDAAFVAVAEALAEVGAGLSEPSLPEGPFFSHEDEQTVLCYEFAEGLDAYFSRRSGGKESSPRTIEDLLWHLRDDPAERYDLFGAELVEKAVAAKADGAAAYAAALANKTRAQGFLDDLFSGPEAVDVVAVPAMPPAWLIDHVVGDQVPGTGWSPAAIAGYPSATLPYGSIGGLPVGVALLGPAWSEATLLRVMFALEGCLGPELTRPMPGFAESVSLRAL